MIMNKKEGGFFGFHFLKSIIGILFLFLGLTIYFIIIVYPLFWMIMSSFKESSEIFSNVWALPSPLDFSNYVKAWNQGISDYFINSVIVTLLTCFLTVGFSCLGAYGLTRFKFKGNKLLLFYCMGGLMFAPQVSLVPLFEMVQFFNIYNTYWAMVFPYVAFQIPVALLLIRSYFLSIPKELEEAARMDGCNSFTVFIKIFLPISKPILMTSFVLTAYFAWNEFLFALVFISDSSMKTIPAGLMKFQGALSTEWGVLLAGLTISAIPIVVLFLFTQKYFIRGLASGGVKG